MDKYYISLARCVLEKAIAGLVMAQEYIASSGEWDDELPIQQRYKAVQDIIRRLRKVVDLLGMDVDWYEPPKEG